MPRTNHKLYQVFDVVAETVMGPILVSFNDQMAAREFAKWCTQGELKANVEDYRLLRLGTIDDYGNITAEDPSVVITGSVVMETLRRQAT